MDQQIRHSQEQVIKTILAISKKHWFSYIIPIFLLFLGLFFSLISPFFIICIYFGATRILSNIFTSWTLTDEELIIKSGFLPWRKTHFEIPKEDIYEAFYHKSLFGNIFNFGTITIRRTEGNTSSFSYSGMTEPHKITGAINSLVREIKKNSKANNSIYYTNNISLADEIQKLVELKNQGILSDDEFNFQKQKLINSK